VAKRRAALRWALRVWSLLTWAVKNSRTRFAAFGVGANNRAGIKPGADVIMREVRGQGAGVWGLPLTGPWRHERATPVVYGHQQFYSTALAVHRSINE
jgi:hypothetical protein